MNKVAQAIKKVRREIFLPVDVADNFEFDSPLPIGFGQTNSQPTTVRMMLEWLEVEPGNKVLDVGSGSGWTTALLSRLTGPKGQVYAVEIVPELLAFGRANCHKYGVMNAEFHLAGQRLGLPQFAPYDRILVSTAAKRLPEELLGQLGRGGRLVIPVNHNVWEVEKLPDGQIETTVHGGFAFVPLINPG